MKNKIDFKFVNRQKELKRIPVVIRATRGARHILEPIIAAVPSRIIKRFTEPFISQDDPCQDAVRKPFLMEKGAGRKMFLIDEVLVTSHPTDHFLRIDLD